MVGTASGLALGTLFSRGAGSIIGAALGAVLGSCLTISPTVRLHWFEFCYWSHYLVAYSTVALALVARFDVFWPCTMSWGVLMIDKWLQARCSQKMYVSTSDSRCIPGDGSRSSKIRLVLRMRDADNLSFNFYAASR